jgi:hypothetical protein
MTVQFAIVLLLALACVAYFLKDVLGSFLGGSCSSGCGSCQSGGCPVKKLEAIQAGLPEQPVPHRQRLTSPDRSPGSR